MADAVQGNWVDRRAPAWARPYLRLSRADRPIGTWLLLIPCWWGLLLAAAADPGGADALSTSGSPPAARSGAVLMRGAGCTWNDLTDRDIDAQVARTRSRPLPSGQVTPRQAAAWMVAQALAAFAILLSFPWRGGGARDRPRWRSSPSIPSPSASPGGRRCSSGSRSTGGRCSAGRRMPGGWRWAALLLYAAGIAWTLFYDTIYAHQDREDDALIGVKSTARLFGTRDEALAGRASSSPRRGWRSRRSWRPGWAAAALALALLGVAGVRAASRLAAPPARHRRRRTSA